MKTIALRCFAPDGAYVTEGTFNSVDAAWNRAADMGSRWFFYPISVVTGKKKILDVPYGMSKDWIGRNYSTFMREMAGCADDMCDWINGEIPCPI